MKGIVYTGEGAEVLDGIEVRDPGPGEVSVRVVAAGVCHSDITAASGAFGWPAPAVLGHEGAGIVEQVGQGVTHVAPGDHVIISTLAVCGVCRACAKGKPTRCRQTLGNMAQPFTLDGEPCWNFAAVSVFTEKTVIRGYQAVKIPKDVPLTSACLVGCGVVTGAGSVLFRSNVQIGDTAVVYGCGGVGLNAIQALRVKRAERIIAIDVEPAKEALARQFGATDFIDGRSPDVVEQVRRIVPYSDTELSGPFNAGGVDWVYDVVARPEVTANALEMLDWGGTVVIIGTPGGDARFDLPYQRFTQNERGVIGSRAGSYSPHSDIPQIIDLYRRGEFMLDELVSATYPLEGFPDAVHDMHEGKVARGVLTIG
ncbi:MAG: alcohol dehydrogenase catalytic domain-containing protein [Acidimicrobiales bacterium]|jgi:S-(hydroxymethyl)glutathione dehydrogenase/alcohol dehydrogenase|nr:alcohol dehydrogenase catalytic domain-containing protein [Acidimicrobiales bacterium]